MFTINPQNHPLNLSGELDKRRRIDDSDAAATGNIDINLILHKSPLSMKGIMENAHCGLRKLITLL